jgi:hypothetical protein
MYSVNKEDILKSSILLIRTTYPSYKRLVQMSVRTVMRNIRS